MPSCCRRRYDSNVGERVKRRRVPSKRSTPTGVLTLSGLDNSGHAPMPPIARLGRPRQVSQNEHLTKLRHALGRR